VQEQRGEAPQPGQSGAAEGGLGAGLAAARARGRTGGRPPALAAADKQAARALLKDPAITMEEVAKRLQVSPATLYRHLPGGRSGLDEAKG